MHAEHTYDNFIVGLTNINPNVSTPTLWNYVVCGQYLDHVSNGTTVSLYCRDNLPPFRYVIVQLPEANYHFVACEIEVLVRGTRMSNISILIYTTHAVRCCYFFYIQTNALRLYCRIYVIVVLLGKINMILADYRITMNEIM